MPTRLGAQRALISSIAVGLGALALGVPTAASAEPTEDPRLQAVAASYYAEKHGVSIEEATRRLKIQDDAAELAKDLATQLGGNYGGVWFAAESEDPVKIGVEAPKDSNAAEEARDAASAEGVGERTDVVSVDSSFADLTTSQKTLDEGLGSLVPQGKARSLIDPTINSLVVETARDLSEEESAHVQAAMDKAATAGDDRVQVRPRATQEASLLVPPNACDLPFCDRPLRGGVKVLRNGTTWYCTNGFNSRSRSDPSAQYALTAGHCPDRTDEIWESATTSGRLFDIGGVWNRQYPGDGDAAIVSNNGFWNDVTPPGPYVVVDASSSTTLDTFYEINNEATSSVGQVV